MLEGYVVDGICRSFLFSDMLHTSKVTGLRVSADDRPEVVLDVFLDDDADGGLEVPSRVGGSRGGKNHGVHSRSVTVTQRRRFRKSVVNLRSRVSFSAKLSGAST